MGKFTKDNYKRLRRYMARNGVRAAVYKVIERLERDDSELAYSQDVFDLIADKEQAEYERSVDFTHRYKFSVIVPAYETGEKHITEMIKSVLTQTYDNVEICIADASVTDDVEKAVKAFGTGKIKYRRLAANGGISENTNEALKMADGEYVLFVDHDDILTGNALFEVMNVLEAGLVSDGGILTNRVKMIYSDEDKCDENRTVYFDHHIKPDFDIDLLRTNNYICHLLVVRRELAMSVGGFRKEFDGAQDHDFILRCSEKLSADEIKHIDKVLYHWRSHESSTSTNPDSKLYAYEAGKRAVSEHLKRLNIQAEVTDTEHLGFYRVKYKVTAEDLTKVQIMSLSELKAMDKNARLEADFEYIMVLNDTVKPKNYEFIEEMLGILKRDEVGCVGGLVINRGKIESAGYSVDKDGVISPDFCGLNKNFSGYLHRAKLVHEVSGVCTDCMMVKKSAITDEGTLKPDMLVVYCPYSVFKRIK